MSEEQCRKLSLLRKGRPSPNKGKTFPEEYRKNLSISHTGKKQSPETIQKRIETRKHNKLLKAS
jgi:hypothetical protein